MSEQKPTVKIRDWEIVDGIALFGNAENHPKLGSGPIQTSILVRIDMPSRTVETMNTIYMLIGDSAKEQRKAREKAALSAIAKPATAETNTVTLDRRDLFDFVRGAIKRALEDASHGAAESHEPICAADCWSDAHARTEAVFDALGLGEETKRGCDRDA